jgi:predicted metal-dependent hydrolase
MALKTISIPEIGEVTLAKRRGTRHIRLTITARGQVRIGMPLWTPYSIGIEFAKSKSDWINKQLAHHSSGKIVEGSRIGKAHRIYFVSKNSGKITSRVEINNIYIYSHLPPSNAQVQKKAGEAGEKALGMEAKQLLPNRLEVLAKKHGYSYNGTQVKKLTSRWGSCSSEKVITLSYYLIQLPWHLIDYVLVHELIHTRPMNHSPAFWREVEAILGNVKEMRKEIKSHKPKLTVAD